jgi:hypothetical protein
MCTIAGGVGTGNAFSFFFFFFGLSGAMLSDGSIIKAPCLMLLSKIAEQSSSIPYPFLDET